MHIQSYADHESSNKRTGLTFFLIISLRYTGYETYGENTKILKQATKYLFITVVSTTPGDAPPMSRLCFPRIDEGETLQKKNPNCVEKKTERHELAYSEWADKTMDE